MDRRTFLAATAAAAATALPVAAQGTDFGAVASYSAQRRGVSLVVMREGRIAFEDYPNRGGPDEGHELASGTKSFNGVIAAAAALDGLLRWDEVCADTLPEWRDDRRRDITIRHVLSLTSGIDSGPVGRPRNFADAITAIPLTAPGARFAYASDPFQIFGAIIQRKTGEDPVAYLQRRIFAPLNITPTHWRRSSAGDPHMPSGAGLTARDWARFGWFVLRDGEGRVDAEALSQCFAGSRANPGYGLSWWLWREGLIAPRRVQAVNIDTELTQRFGPISMAAGAGDQRLYLLPQQRLVVARQASGILRAIMGRERGPSWSDGEFLRLLLGA